MPTVAEPRTRHQKEHDCDHKPMVVRVFVYRRRGVHFACCYDLNLVAQGKTQDEALHNLQETVLFYLNSELSEGKTFGQIKRIPPLYFRIKFAYVLFRVL